MNIAEFIKAEEEKQSDAERALRLILADGQPLRNPLRKARRLERIQAAAEANFYSPTATLYQIGENPRLNPPQSVNEMGYDEIEVLGNLVAIDYDIAHESKTCETCREYLPPEAFYNYGSPSCRKCNTWVLENE
jgi:hypothetical protein